jgi:predicted DsbA family dithiol-disulfide isomerase
MANKIAIENKFVSAQMVEATEFPHLAMKYNVRGVPRTMVGENFPIEGALPEEAFVRKVLEAYNQLK